MRETHVFRRFCLSLSYTRQTLWMVSRPFSRGKSTVGVVKDFFFSMAESKGTVERRERAHLANEIMQFPTIVLFLCLSWKTILLCCNPLSLSLPSFFPTVCRHINKSSSAKNGFIFFYFRQNFQIYCIFLKVVVVDRTLTIRIPNFSIPFYVSRG